MAQVTFSKYITEDFWARVDRAASGECWLWTGRLTPGGYGIWSGAGTHLAHRFSLAMKTGYYPPSDLPVLHSCDHRACVNPGHLTLGTHDENMRQMVLRGRHGHGLLTADAVVRVLHNYYMDGEPIDILALAHEVSPSVIRRIVRGESYRPIYEEFVIALERDS